MIERKGEGIGSGRQERKRGRGKRGKEGGDTYSDGEEIVNATHKTVNALQHCQGTPTARAGVGVAFRPTVI